jgi:2,3-bisphosphoglycerate-independent phosphoglycerate mutase
MRQLIRSFLDPHSYRKFIFFRTLKILNINLVTLTSYHLDDLKVIVAFKPAKIKNHLTEILSQKGFKQLHVAESEKLAHVTYFFNGGVPEAYPGEQRIIIPSLKSGNLTAHPEMSANEIKKAVIDGVRCDKYDFILANFANVDMIAHTGNIEASVKAIDIVDNCLDEIIKETQKKGGVAIITADHGNAEQVVQLQQAEPETLHTLNPVPFILVASDRQKTTGKIETVGQSLLAQIITTPYSLADVAPTILELLNIPKPYEMSGHSLLDDLH